MNIFDQITESLSQLDIILTANKSTLEAQIKLKERLLKNNVEKELLFHQKIHSEHKKKNIEE